MNLFKLFKIAEDKHDDCGQLFEKIYELGADMAETELKKITATAGLCGRVAYADTEITDDEISKIKAMLRNDSKLSANAADIVVTLILEKKVELLTLEEHFYTRLANESMDDNEKRSLLKNMFLIAAADGTICLEEENMLFNVASQLKLPRQAVVDLKREFKDYLSVFQSDK